MARTMSRLWTTVVLCGVFLVMSQAAAARSVCQPIGSGQLRCTIRSVEDCLLVENYPYARNLYCPASFNAVNQVFETLIQALEIKKPIQQQFFFYQTQPPRNASSPGALDPAQTTLPCLETPAPWAGGPILGAGKPLCDLMAYVSSIGSNAISIPSNGNPLPPVLRGYPDYFSHLLSDSDNFPFTGFKTGGVYDPLIRSLGSDGAELFKGEVNPFSTASVYRPSPSAEDPRYWGISGGGGAGWGGEIVLTSRGTSRTLLAFGGGGGGGLTSRVNPDPSSTASSLGAGGGGGMQFANGYRNGGKSYNQLGLGAGTSSNEPEVQYSYYQPITGRVTNDYDPELIADYQTQLAQLFAQLDEGLRQGGEIVFKGGGGMGAGAEYLRSDGEEYVPHAVSTQAGFQFRFRVGKAKGFPILPIRSVAPPESVVSSQQKKLYLAMGNIYQFANQQALQECGNSYENYACICPASQAIVICLAHRVLGGNLASIPGWIQQAHCPVANGSSDELDSLVNAVPDRIHARLKPKRITIDATDCKKAVADYFNFLRTAASPND